MPVKTFLNCTIPALVNMSVGSLRGTSELDGTTLCPFLEKKLEEVRSDFVDAAHGKIRLKRPLCEGF